MFYRLVAEFPEMAIEIMRELAHRLEDTNQKLRAATKAG
jgi:CRP-like cAMP-binding protein